MVHRWLLNLYQNILSFLKMMASRKYWCYCYTFFKKKKKLSLQYSNSTLFNSTNNHSLEEVKRSYLISNVMSKGNIYTPSRILYRNLYTSNICKYHLWNEQRIHRNQVTYKLRAYVSSHHMIPLTFLCILLFLFFFLVQRYKIKFSPT